MARATRSSAIDRPRHRRGYTLVESMIASVLLAASVAGVAGMMTASYAHDEHSVQQHDARSSADSLMSELTALPFDAGANNDVGLSDFNAYSDTTNSTEQLLATAKLAQSRGKTSSTTRVQRNGLLDILLKVEVGLIDTVKGILGGKLGGNGTSVATTPAYANYTRRAATTLSRNVKVERYNSLGGMQSPTGKLAIVTVDVTVNGQTVRLKRLISTAEAEGGAN